MTRNLAALCILALACLLGSQCNSPLVTPATGRGTEYPCGLRANLCPDRKSCCPLDYDCGDGLHGCPADACCYGGGSMMGAHRGDAGAGHVLKTAPR